MKSLATRPRIWTALALLLVVACAHTLTQKLMGIPNRWPFPLSSLTGLGGLLLFYYACHTIAGLMGGRASFAAFLTVVAHSSPIGSFVFASGRVIAMLPWPSYLSSPWITVTQFWFIYLQFLSIKITYRLSTLRSAITLLVVSIMSVILLVVGELLLGVMM